MTTPTKTLLATGIAAVVVGGGLLVRNMLVVPVEPSRDYVFPISYPSDINPHEFIWTVIASSNLIEWHDKPSYRSNQDIVVTRSGNVEFYRLKGTK